MSGCVLPLHLLKSAHFQTDFYQQNLESNIFLFAIYSVKQNLLYVFYIEASRDMVVALEFSFMTTIAVW